ncbi:hypothetical protein LIER_00128 [Lithospermum erythrorhizon]|uniref:Uncharacterized protein n=1 Tax=Lithospermum erythrorhizon TaxID=34254 RepID=A0AAV3NHU4_LITER
MRLVGLSSSNLAKFPLSRSTRDGYDASGSVSVLSASKTRSRCTLQDQMLHRKNFKDNKDATPVVDGEPSPNVTEASHGRHVATETIQLSKKRKRATDKRPSKKVATPAADGEEASKKKGPRVSQTLEGFRKVTETSAVATCHLRHIRDHYGVETVVRMRIPFAGENIDAPLVHPAAGRGDPMDRVLNASTPPLVEVWFDSPHPPSSTVS